MPRLWAGAGLGLALCAAVLGWYRPWQAAADDQPEAARAQAARGTQSAGGPMPGAMPSAAPGLPVAPPALAAGSLPDTAAPPALTAVQQHAFDALLAHGSEAAVDPSAGVPPRIDLRRSARRQASDASTDTSAVAAPLVSAAETELPVFPAASVVAGQSWRRVDPGGGSTLGLTLQAQATLAQVLSFYRAQMPEGVHDQVLTQLLSRSADGFDLRQADLRQGSLKRVEVAAVPPAVFIHLTLTRTH